MSTAGLRLVVADDDPFAVSLVADGLRLLGFSVMTAATVEDAWQLTVEHEPHAVISDLDFRGRESGASLLSRIHAAFPWIGLVVLTAHRTPELAVERPEAIPAGAVYLVKSALRSVEELAEAVRSSISGDQATSDGLDPDEPILVLTAAQAEVLRMLAAGASTRRLAERRGTTVRAAETMLARLYAALGLDPAERAAARVEAVRLWQQGRVTTK